MGIGHEIWQVEVIKRASVWVKDNIKLDLQEIGKQSLDIAQENDR